MRVFLAAEGSTLTISSNRAFEALVLASMPSGDGAFLNCDVAPGTTIVKLPLSGDGLMLEVVDSRTGAVTGTITV
ncbi:hypothetical protein QE364_002707 [Nocardioides zeae]|uniref:Uncharacterized protein n=2 Tax=Nocardioides zeae TaxID=1457234 RepID=A0AAJ1U6Z2_9ACTN|nr:hypothetical protein [Nocardioides zeae]MDQ1106758.1 hypothetical protein [Nocardioides zeae]MDR6173583.1 hypothetical protein [Nocardioides zeae]MDR6210988.1 hypothetical protein [Nocardioides zeae]